MNSANVNSQIAISLRNYREQCGYSQKQVADSLGIDRSTYSYYEIGKTTPSISTIMRIANLFNIDCTQLLPSEDKQKSLHDINLPELQLFDLDKREINLILNYRMLPEEEQEKLLNILDQFSKHTDPSVSRTLEMRICENSVDKNDEK